jgi:hypothetical protein
MEFVRIILIASFLASHSFCWVNIGFFLLSIIILHIPTHFLAALITFDIEL